MYKKAPFCQSKRIFLPFSLTSPSWLLSPLMTVVTYSILTYWVQWPFQGHRKFYSCGFCTQLSCWVMIDHVLIQIFFLFLWKLRLKNASSQKHHIMYIQSREACLKTRSTLVLFPCKIAKWPTVFIKLTAERIFLISEFGRVASAVFWTNHK